jgi:hypothetical protein
MKTERHSPNMGLSRMLILAGVVLLIAGLLVAVGERLHVPFGRLPGDIVVRGKAATFYFPVVTCLLLSLAGSLLLWLFRGR